MLALVCVGSLLRTAFGCKPSANSCGAILFARKVTVHGPGRGRVQEDTGLLQFRKVDVCYCMLVLPHEGKANRSEKVYLCSGNHGIAKEKVCWYPLCAGACSCAEGAGVMLGHGK